MKSKVYKIVVDGTVFIFKCDELTVLELNGSCSTIKYTSDEDEEEDA